MLNLQGYKGLIWRFALAGTLNSIVGFSAIFFLMALGVSPLLANLAGYALGLSIGFKTSKSFVFRSKGKWAVEGVRFIATFGLSYLANILVLAATLDWLAFPPFLAQTAAVSTYVVVMYLLSYFFVFSNTLDARNIKSK
jgi:putative flippase GtrA